MPEHRGKHRFGKQIGAWASFAEVEVVVESGPPALIIEVDQFDRDPSHQDWLAGIQFGIRHALSKLPLRDRDVVVRVTSLDTNPVDSSVLSVAFASCFAFWNAVGHRPTDPPYFDDRTKSFTFPV